MAPSPSPFSCSPDLPNSNPTSNPNSIVTFSSRPLQNSKDQQLLLSRAKRRRQRALRMSREKQIPALMLHCASPFQTVPCFKGSPHCFSNRSCDYANAKGNFRQFSKEASSILHSSPGGAIVIYDGMLAENKMSKLTQTFSECSGGEGDVSDVGSDRGPDLFERRNWRDGSSSSPSSSAYESPLNVSKAFSFDENSPVAAYTAMNNVPSSNLDDKFDEKKGSESELSAEYWKLQADVLTAECKLLRVEKELAVRRWNQECVNNGVSCQNGQALNAAPESISKERSNMEDVSYSRSLLQRCAKESQTKETVHDASKKLHKTSYTSKCFTQEALRQLEEISHRSSCQPVPPEDPTEALQKRLQGLLLAAQSSSFEQGSQMHSTSAGLKFRDVWGGINLQGIEKATRETRSNNRCFAETAAYGKQLDFVSLELSETKDAAAYIRSEYRSMLSGEKGLHSENGAHQMAGEDMFCKAAIRQIVAQVQAESEQWSQVQDILRSLQEEMEILIETRELSEKRALRAEAELVSLKKAVHDWRCRALSAEEEVMMLQSERQALKLRIQMLKQKHADEHRSWYEEDNVPSEVVTFPITDTTQPSLVSSCEVEEQPRLANVGTQEDYALCESIVHSRNESSRSSVDLGTTSQRCTQRNIKKSLDFSNSSNEGNTSKSRVRSHRFTDQIRKIEPTRLDFCSKTSDVNNGARHKLSGGHPKVELTRLECVEPVCMTEYKERKKARLFAFKENRSMSGPIDTHAPLSVEPFLRRSSLGNNTIATQDLLDHVISSKSKSSLPSAPTSTPSRLPFGEIFNSPSSH